jgi:hypothetical protein
MSGGPVRVLFIGGFGRSGSTLLDMLLGQVPGFFSAGELRHIWERGFRENQLCSCGAAFRDCRLWGAVVRAAFGEPDAVDHEAIIAAKRAVDRMRNIYLLARGGGSPAFNAQLDIYRRASGRLYAAIAQVTGCSVVVDSSKTPAHGFLMRGLPEVDLRAVLLVRDSRATAYSWMRVRKRPEIPGREELMPRHSPAKSALLWSVRNHFVELLGRGSTPLLRVRYEDLVADPAARLREVVAFCGPPAPASFAFLAGHTLTPGAQHQVAGNPLRFRRGPLTIRDDDEWRTLMSPAARLAVTLLTLPGLLRHGYRW